jgi:hypothetical protein
LVLAFVAGACTETFDAGSNRPHGLLPVDERNPVVIINDGAYDNWQGEYAIVLANDGGPPLAGIIVKATQPWPDIKANRGGWNDLVAAARASGLRNIPDPTTSIGSPLVRPASGDIEATQPNNSEGARFIVDESNLLVKEAKRLRLPYRPLVVVTGTLQTDVADAYLIDPTVVDRVVVVSSMGGVTSSGAGMGSPNGEFDPWAATIVATRFRYIQVSAFYDQLTDVPASDLDKLPDNTFGTWIRDKQPKLYHWEGASDQVALLAAGIPKFATSVERVAAAGPVDAGAANGPDLMTDPNGSDWVVTHIASNLARERLWKVLNNPAAFKR